MENGKWKTVATDSANCCDATRDFLEADLNDAALRQTLRVRRAEHWLPNC